MKTPKAIKLKSGNWNVQIQVDGKRYSCTAPTKKEAQDKAKQIFAGAEMEKRIPLTVGKAIDKYIEERKGTLSPYTIKGYSTIRNQYFHDLMDINISDLTQADIQRAVIAEEAKGKSAKTIKNAHGLLTATLREFRPTFQVNTKLPKKKTIEPHLPTEDEMKKIWQAGKGNKYELPVLFASWMGLRMSEVRGLKFSDISEDGVLHVQRALIHVKGQDIEKPPKTASGDRRIKMPEVIMKLVKVKRPKSEDNYICPFSISAINNGFIRICKKASVEPCRFHDLRHFAASEALALGVPDKYSMKRMGHATENMLKTVYQHTMKEKEDEFANLIDEHLEELYNKE